MIDEALAELQDQAAKDRILSWAWDKFSSRRGQPESQSPRPVRRKGGRSKPASSPKGKPKPTASVSPSIVKDLNLMPEGKASFRSFAATKNPSSNHEKNTVAVYYLQKELAVTAITSDHVYTCYKDASWRVPAQFRNSLAKTAHIKGWIDTRDMASIRITTQGENLVEHDLPRQKEGDK